MLSSVRALPDCPPDEGPGPGPDDWLGIAREVADDLATDAVARDQAGKPPEGEVALLRESGLLTLLIPAERGGGGADWTVACGVIRELAVADGSIGQLLACHYLLSWSARFFGSPEFTARVEREAARERWFWGGAVHPEDPGLTLAPAGDNYVLSGREGFTTGAQVADRLVVAATRSDTGEQVVLMLDPARAGVVCNHDADTFGQRLSAGGSVECDDVKVTYGDILGSLSTDEYLLSPFAAMAAPASRLLSVHLCLGIAEGALAEAREYTRTRGRPCEPAGSHPATRDPLVLTAYGELTVTAHAAAALAEGAVAAFVRGLARGDELTDDERGEIAARTATAQAAASKAVLEITSRSLDVADVRSTASHLGFDLFWRNARAHTLHDPPTHTLLQVGDHFLNGTQPPFTLHT